MKKTNKPLPPLQEGELLQLQSLKLYMETHLHQSLTIQQLSKTAGVNRQKLKQLFKQAFQITIHQYLMKERMEKAKTLLLTTPEPLKQIAARVGYSPRNFYNRFKKYYRNTPHSLRKK